MAVVANRLRDGEDVRFVERPPQRGASVSARSEYDLLCPIAGVDRPLVVFASKRLGIDELIGRRRLARVRMNRHGWPGGDHLSAGASGRTFQMSRQYSRTERSDENRPTDAQLTI